MTIPRDRAPSSPDRALTPDAWRRIKQIVADALERAPSERPTFLDHACGADSDLRHEVDSLLAAADDDHFLEQPAVVSAGLVAPSSDASELFTRLSRVLADRYTLVREIGGGGMSRLFLAHEHVLDRPLVIKVLSPELTHALSTERFAREVRVAARMQQANIVPLISADVVDGLPYLTMPFVRGLSLRDLCASASPVPVSEAVSVLKDIARALAYAHAEGVVHRDIKPENVLLSLGAAMVTDFGIAKAVTEARTDREEESDTTTQPGTFWGTPRYMSPEQALGEPDLDQRTDVYSFGIVAYELLAGAHPFADRKKPTQYIAAHLSATPRPIAEVRADIPPRLEQIVMRCLEKNRDDRFDSGRELLEALEALSAVSTDVVASAEESSIAVLPFANLSGNPDDEYFSDGITEEVINTLARMHGLRVAARSSSFAFKGKHVDPRIVAEQLGVKTVLEGSVRRVGSRVRIGVQLVSAADGLTLWNERYERELADIFAVWDEIARAIGDALSAHVLAGGDRGASIAPIRGVRRGSIHPEAFELYLRGRHLVEQRSDGMMEALSCFEQSIRLDPQASAAHSGLGYTFAMFGIYHALRPREAFPQARAAADRARAIDETDALALVVRAAVALWFEWDREEAEILARRALELAPGLYLAHDCLGWALASQGRFEEAIAAMERGRVLDPLSDYATYDLGWVLILSGRWEQAIHLMRPAVARHPQSSELRRVFAYALFHAGRVDEAVTELQTVLELNPSDRWAPPNLAQALAALGKRDAALRLVREIEERMPHEPLPAVGLAIAYHALGDDAAALTWLERALDARDYWLVMLRYDPSMRSLRGDKRFEALMRQV